MRERRAYIPDYPIQESILSMQQMDELVRWLNSRNQFLAKYEFECLKKRKNPNDR